MTVERIENVSSIVVIPSNNTAVFNVSTATVLPNGKELSPTTETITVELAADSTLLADLLALIPVEGSV